MYIAVLVLVLAIVGFYFFSLKKEKEYFKSRFTVIATLLFDVGLRIDDFEEYKDRFLYIHSQLEQIKDNSPKDGLARLDDLETNIKHLKLDMEAKETLSFNHQQ